jgi:hypothetical protein
VTQQTWQGSCSSANVIGTCAAPFTAISGVTALTRYYSGAPATAQQLKEACEVGLNGVWATP